MRMEVARYRIMVDQTTSKTFTVEAVLKQDDKLSLLLFNLPLEKAISNVQKEATGLQMSQ